MTDANADLTERARALGLTVAADWMANSADRHDYRGLAAFVEKHAMAALQSVREAAIKEMMMNTEQQNLLLTVARILRAQTRHSIDAWAREDYAALNEALKPFDATPSEPINEELR